MFASLSKESHWRIDTKFLKRCPKLCDEDITSMFFCLSLFLSLVVTLLCFSTISVTSKKCLFVKPISRPPYFFISRQ